MNTMRRTISAIPVLGIALTLPVAGQTYAAREHRPLDRSPMADPTTPEAYHAALTRMSGTWDVRITEWTGPRASPVRGQAEADIALAVGERFLEETLSGHLGGAPFLARGLTGYDDIAGRVESVWLDSRVDAMTTLHGSLTLPGDEFRLDGAGVDPTTGAHADLRQNVRILSPDEFVVTLYTHRDGHDVKTMERIYSRK